jgi:transposase
MTQGHHKSDPGNNVWPGRRLRFVWPQAKDGAVFLTPAQLSTLLEGIDWRAPARTWRPDLAG